MANDHKPQGKIRLLHVDDEPDQLLFTKQLMEIADPDITVESINSPLKALELFSGYDCVLTDYQMPEMDGIEFARRIKKGSDIPVILYTGRGSEEVASAAFDAGINDYLRKEMDPGHYQVLSRRIRHAVETQRVERALRESEKRYRVVLDSSSNGVAVLIDNKFAYINQRGVKMLGYGSPSDLLGKGVEIVIAPEERERVLGYAKARREGGNPPQRYEMKQLRADGSTALVENVVTPIQYYGRDASLVVTRDITEAKRLETEKSTLLATIPDGLSLVDREYRYQWINETEAARVGKKPEELIGVPCYETFNKRTSPCTGCHVPDVFKTGKRDEWVVTDSTGRTWIEMASPILDGGVVVSVIVLSRDITDVVKSQTRTNALHTSTLRLDSAETEDDVWSVVFSALTDVLGYKQTGIGLVEDGYLKFKAPYRVVKRDNLLPLEGKGVTIRALKTKRTQVISDTLKEPDYVPANPDNPDAVFRSEVVVPVIVDGEVVAVLNAENLTVDGFTDDDRRLIEILALYAAQALRRIRLRSSERHHQERLEALLNYARQLPLAENVEAVTKMTLDIMERVLQFEFISVLIVTGGKLWNISARGAPMPDLVLSVDGKGLTSRAAREKRTVVVNDTRQDPDFVYGSLQSLSEVIVPVVLEGRVEYLLNTESTKAGAYDEADVRLTEILAGHVASALTSLRVRERVKQEGARLDALQSSALRLATASTPDEVWDISMESLRTALGFKEVTLARVEGDRFVFFRALGLELPPETAMPIGTGVMGRAVATRSSQLVIDTQSDPNFYAMDGYEGRFRSELATPVMVDDTVVAVINSEDEKPGAYTEEDRAVMEALASHTSQALKRIQQLNQLSESERRYKILLDSSSDGICVLTDNLFAYCNQRAAEMWGVPDPSHLIGKSVVDYVAPEDRGMILKYAQERREGRNPPQMYEVKLLRVDGTTLDTESHVTLIDYDGKPSSLVVSRDISERKRLEAAVKESEEQYKNFLDQQRDAVFVLNTERYMYANQVAAEMLGYSSPEEIVGLPSYSIVAPVDRVKVKERTEARAQGKPVPDKYELRLLRRDGTEIETEVNATLIYYEGKPVSLGVHRDITERNRVAAELKASEERYRGLIEASLDAIYVVQDGKYVFANMEAAKILGYDDPAQILNRDIVEFYHPDEKERIRQYLRERGHGGSPPTEYSTRLVKLDGSEVIIDSKVALIEYNGRPATLAIGRDVTTKRRTEETLRRSEAEKTALLATIPDSLSLIDSDYRYLWVNEAEAASYGLKPEDLLGKPCYSIQGKEGGPCDGCPIETVFKLGHPEKWTNSSSDGRLWENRASPILDAAGGVASILVLSKDITDLKRSQWRTNALHASALKIESINTEDDVWQAAHDALTGVLGYKNAAVGIVEDDHLIFKAKYRVIKVDTVIPLSGKGVTLRAIRSLKPQIVRDTRVDGDYFPGGSEFPPDSFKSELAVPIIVDGKAIAVLNTESIAPDSYSEDDQRLIEILALYAAQAIKRIRQMKQLSDSELKYRQLAENAADVLLVVSLDGTITYMSKGVNPHIGFTREEIVGHNFAEFISKADSESLMAAFGSADANTGDWAPLTIDVVKKSGGAASLEFNPSPIVTDGKVTGILVVVRDVSTRIDLQKKLTSLHTSAHLLHETNNLDDVWEIAVETLRSVLGFRRADIGVVIGDCVKFSHGLNKERPTLTLPLDGKGVTVRAIKTQRTQLVRDVTKDESYIPGIENPMVYASELVVPIISDGRAIAVINLEENRLNAFAAEDIHLAETLGLHISSAVSRLWHAEEARKEGVRLAALHESSIKLSAATTIEEVWRLVFEDLKGVMGYDLTGVGVVGDETIRFTRGTSQMPPDSFEVPLNRPSVTARAVSTKETQLVKDVSKDPDYIVIPGVDVTNFTSELTVPIIVDGEVIAVINVEAKSPSILNEVDARLVETLALHAATAVSRLRQQEDERRYRQRLEVLNKHASDLEDVETLEDALRLTYDALVALGLTFPSISLLQGDALVVPPIEGRDSVKPMRLPLEGPGITVRAVKTKSTQLVNDASVDPDLVPSPDRTMIGSELVAPLRIGEEIVGVLNLENTRKNAYTEEDARIVEMLAAHVSSTLNRLRILEGLHKEVEDRTSALLAAEQMAAVGRVSAMVAHDLRVPLQTISNASRLIQQKPEKTPEMLTYINSAVDRSVRMLEDLRLNTREEPLRLAPTNLHALITQTIKEMQQAKGVEYDIRIDDGVGSVPLDPLKMRRVFDNLFRNAVEAMPEGGWITISARRVVDVLVVEVSDTGKGIPAEVMEKLFRPFSSTKMSGLGLGLTYCKKAVEAHGGTIGVENVQGSGAKFTIRIPIK